MKAVELRISPRAVRDLEEIALYIAHDNPRRAITFIGELRQQCRKLAETPMAYRSREELGPNLRASSYGHYVIFFQYSGTVVTIIRILHEARDVGPQFDA